MCDLRPTKNNHYVLLLSMARDFAALKLACLQAQLPKSLNLLSHDYLVET